MTDSQLYLAISVPIVFNAAMLTLMVTLLRDLWRAELRPVEEVLDARLRHVEERLEHIENR
jgi:low affinity Fe/Cu permease